MARAGSIGPAAAGEYELNVTANGPAFENVMNGAAGDDPPAGADFSGSSMATVAHRRRSGISRPGGRGDRLAPPRSRGTRHQVGPTARGHLPTQLSDQRKPVRPSQSHDRPGREAGDGEFPTDHDSERAAARHGERGKGRRVSGGRLADLQTGHRVANGEGRQNEALRIDPSFIQPASIYQRIQQFKSGSAIGSAVVFGLALLVVFFLLITLAAVVYAVVLTRSITGAVHHLYEGTMKVEAGDFDHEIPITGRDQLAGLTKSFNRMTGSVRELLRVSAEKQRLDQEMKIAAAVQSRLFPRSIPNSERLDIAKGVCIPARSVSGDYYDLLDIAPGVIGVVVADVCGKGVSAALMMANLQANLRGQAQARRDTYKNGVPPPPCKRRQSGAACRRARQPTGRRLDDGRELYYPLLRRVRRAAFDAPIYERRPQSAAAAQRRRERGGGASGGSTSAGPCWAFSVTRNSKRRR